MQISPTGLDLIKRFEGFSAAPYLCPAGKWTIGYGHVIRDSGFGIRDSGMSEEEAHALLLADLAPVEVAINRLVTAPITQSQFDALCSLIYNIGVGAFARSTLLRLLNAGGQGAPAQFLRWIYAGGTPLAGLRRRRQAERELFENNGL